MKKILLIFIFLPLYISAQFNNPIPIIRGLPYIREQRLCDTDGDNKLDLIIPAREHDHVYVYPNDGSGSFNDRDTLIFGLAVTDIDLQDLNQDNLPDLVVLADSSVYVFENQGNNSFFRRFSYTAPVETPYDPEELMVQDMNGDNLPDFVISNEVGSVWINQGNFNFINTANYTDNDGTNRMAAADMNGDGFMDIMWSSLEYIYTSLNDHNNQFELSSTTFINTGLSPHIEDFVVHDVDQDGDPDLIVSTGSSTTYVVAYINDGLGNLTRGTELYVTSQDVILSNLTIQDINGDEFTDLIFAIDFSHSGTSTFLYCYPGVAGGFGPREVLISGLDINHCALVVGDVIPGGYPEIVSISRMGVEKINLLSSSSPFTFSLERRIDWFPNPLPESLEPLQLDEDPELEIYTPPAMHDHIGNDKYVTKNIVPEDFGLIQCIDDLDEDGTMDVIISDGAYTVKWYKGIQSGDFDSISNPINNDPYLISVDTCTYNSNLNNQLVLLYRDKIQVHYENNGFYTGSIQCLESFTSTLGNLDEWDFKRFISNPTQIKWALIANDRQEVYVATSDGITQLSENNSSAHDIHVWDWDGDGLEDVLYADMNILHWYKHMPDGTFSQQAPVVTVDQYLNFKIGDLDQDGDGDIVYSSWILHWIENYGAGLHSSGRDFVMPGSFVDQVFQLKDLDSDGDPEIFSGLGMTFNKVIYLFKNDLSTRSSVSGKIFKDLNVNGVQDNGETAFANILFTSQDGKQAYSDQNGNFSFGYVDSAIVISPQLPLNWYLTTDSLSFSLTSQQVDEGIDDLLFGLAPSSFIKSAEPDFFSPFPQCNKVGNLILVSHNTGTTRHNGIMELELADSLVFIEAQPAADSVSNGLYYWHYDDLEEASQFQVVVKVLFPDFQSIESEQETTLKVFILDDQMNVDTIVTKKHAFASLCVSRPNNKQVEPEGLGENGLVAPNEYFTYTIGFQNTGTDTALNVRVVDRISDILDLSTLEVLAASHSYRLRIMEHNKLVFHFDSIMLPDSTADFIGSQGYIRFRIKHLPGVPLGAVIQNQAQIYFDVNPPVFTNMVTNTLFLCDSLNPQIRRVGTAWCENQAIVFYNSSGHVENYNWVYQGQTISTADTCVRAPQNEGDTLFLQISTQNCFKNDYLVFQVLNPVIHPVCSPGGIIEICPGDSVYVSSDFNDNNRWYNDGMLISVDQSLLIYELGTYILEAEEQGCIGMDTLIVLDRSPTAVILLNGNDLYSYQSCPRHDLSLISNATENQWFFDGILLGASQSITMDNPGTYVLEVSENDCVNRDTFYYSWEFEPVSTLSYEENTLHADTGYNYVYSWRNCNSGQLIPLEHDSYFSPAQNGSYAAILILDSCTYQTDCFAISDLGYEQKNSNGFYIQPNPVKDKLVVYFSEKENCQIRLYDSHGRLLLDKIMSEKEIQLDFKFYSDGLYILHIETKSGWKQAKIVKG